MQETPHATFHLDEPTDGAILGHNRVTCRGWVVGRAAYHATDLRVRLGRRIFPASLGFLRPDLAVHFRARETALPAGFEVEVELAVGDNILEFEFAALSGAWLPLARLSLHARAADPAPAAAPAQLGPHEYARAVEWLTPLHAAPDLPAHARGLADSLPRPHVTRYAHRPFHGHLHLPQVIQESLYGRLIVEGWLLHETTEVRRILGTVDLQALQELRREGGFPYVAELFPQNQQAGACRFHGYLDLPSQLPQPVSLRIYAELADGSLHLCHVQRCFTVDTERQKQAGCVQGAGARRRTERALRRALADTGWPAPPRQPWVSSTVHSWLKGLKAGARLALARTRSPRPSRPAPGAARTRRAILFTHNLQREGAPLFLVEYARWLKDQGWALTVFSPSPGPLAEAFADVAERVRILELTIGQATDPRTLRHALRQLAGQLPLREADLVVANTLSAWWAVHLAHAAGRPSLLYIHESNTPERFFLGHLPSSFLPVVRETFALATHVSFLTDATRRYFAHVLSRPNHSINPGWIDLAAIDRYRLAHPRAQLRAALELPAAGPVVVNLGTVCDRKGQHLFARAVDLLWRTHPQLAAEGCFLMVGGRQTPFDDTVAELVRRLDRPNIRVVPETHTPYAYYAAADVFVCSSFEESFPRVLLEAMAFGLPILSTGVHGIPEIARDGQEALLVAAGDTSALAAGLARIMSEHTLADGLAKAGRSRVVAAFDAARLLPRHAQLAARLVSAAP